MCRYVAHVSVLQPADRRSSANHVGVAGRSDGFGSASARSTHRMSRAMTAYARPRSSSATNVSTRAISRRRAPSSHEISKLSKGRNGSVGTSATGDPFWSRSPTHRRPRALPMTRCRVSGAEAGAGISIAVLRFFCQRRHGLRGALIWKTTSHTTARET